MSFFLASNDPYRSDMERNWPEVTLDYSRGYEERIVREQTDEPLEAKEEDE